MRASSALRVAVFVLASLLAVAASPAWSAEPTIGVWLSPGGPWGIWEKACGDPFPVQRIVGDLTDLGVTDVLFFEQSGRGGPFLHPTRVEHAKTEPRMKGRDFLEELLVQTDRHGIHVWLAWTPPDGRYPGADFEGLNHPALLKLYGDEVHEVGRRYRQHRTLAGILWHEVDCSEAPDQHADDVPEFAEYCRRTFDQKYTGSTMPRIDPADPWWRRYVLYKIEVVNNLVRHTAAVGRQYGLATHFCSYVPEAFRGESWRWGYDIVALERICQQQWFAAYSVESAKPYQAIGGAWLDFGPSYQHQILGRNYAYAFHGRPACYFSYRSPVYLEEMRNYYSKIKSFTEQYGDIYTGFLGRSEKEVELFYGKQNMQHWLGLMAAWQGGVSPARVAVAVNPTPFLMRYPQSPGVEYDKKVRSLMVGLSECLDVDGLVLGGVWALDPANLRAYTLILIPEDMGAGLSPPMAASLRAYVAGGGKLMVISTPLAASKPDLTEPADFTRDLCGLEIVGPGLSGYVSPAKSAWAVPAGTFWAAGAKRVRLAGAEVRLTAGDSGMPLLTQQGNVYFSTVGCNAEGARCFAALVRHLARPPVALTGGSGMRILESVQKDGLLCVSLWGQGRDVLQVDAARLGLASGALRLADIVTGTRLGDFSPEQLAAGVPVQIKYLYQPLILALGPQVSVDRFRGIYPNQDVFQGMKPTVAQDAPEVPEAAGRTTGGGTTAQLAARTPAPVRDKELGILDYAKKYDTPANRAAVKYKAYCDQVAREVGLVPDEVDVDIFLPRNKPARDRFRRILIPAASDWQSQVLLDGMEDYVRSGGLLVTNSSLVILDANANYRVDPEDKTHDFAEKHFLGVRGHQGCSIGRIKVLQDCPFTAGLSAGAWLALTPPTSGRKTRNHSAEVVVICEGTSKDGPATEQPFLTFKHQGDGACVYLVGQVGQTNDSQLTTILKNVLSPATLRWLCRQE